MFCNKCGKELPNGSLFCPYCGAKVNSNIEQQSTDRDVDTQSAKGNSSKIWIVILLIIFTIAGFFFLKEYQERKAITVAYLKECEENRYNMENWTLMDRHLFILNDELIPDSLRNEFYILLLTEERNDVPWKNKEITRRLQELARMRKK